MTWTMDRNSSNRHNRSLNLTMKPAMMKIL